MATRLDLGVHCRQAGICEEDLVTANQPKLTKPVSKGVAYELNIYRKKNEYSWNIFYEWLEQLSCEALPPLATVRVSISRLQKKRSELSRNKRHNEIEELFQEPFFPAIPSRKTISRSVSSHNGSESASQLETVSLELARELSSAKETLVTACHKTEELTAKLSKLRVGMRT